MNKLYLLAILVLSVFIVSCKSSDVELNTAEQVFREGKRLLDKKKYFESEDMFNKIKLQYPTSQFADSSQYYLGEVSMARKEYIMAAFHYSLVERRFPASGLRKEARYKKALCYYNISPGYDRDQEYTIKAIAEFESYKNLYPGDSLFFEAQDRITELTDKLAQREFSIAELYNKIEKPLAAVIYYDFLIDLYPDSDLVEDAQLGKIEMLIFMKKFEKARSALDVYKKEYPKNIDLPIVNKFANEITEGLK